MTPPLSQSAQATLDALRDYIRDNGHPPSVREICDLTGVASTSTVAAQLHSLERSGHITRDPNRARSIVLRPDPDRGDGEGLPSEDLTWGDLDTAALVVVAAPDGTVRVWTEDGTPHAEHAVALRAIADRIDGSSA